MQKLSMKSNILWNSAGSLVYLGCQWFMTVIVVILSEDYINAGLLAIAMAVGNIFIPLSMFRVRTYQVSDVNNEYSSSEYVSFRILTIFGAFVFSLVYSLVTNTIDSFMVVFVFLVYKSIEAFVDVLHGIDQRAMRLDIAGKSQLMRGVITIVVFFAGLYLGCSLEVTLFLAIIPCAIVVGLYDCPRSFKIDKFKIHFSFDTSKSLLKRCFLITVALVSCSAVVSLSRQFLATYGGDALLGVYATLAAPVALIQVGGSYIYSPTLGPLARYYSESKSEFVHYLLKVLMWITFVVGGCCLVLAVFGEPLYSFVFGDSIIGYLFALPPLLVLAALTAYLWFLNDLLVAVRCFRGTVIANFTAFGFSVLLDLIFIPLFGMNGVSFVGIISFFIAILISLIYLIRAVKI